MQNTFKTCKTIERKNESLIVRKKRRHAFLLFSIPLKICAKFKVNRSSRFDTEACEVFITHKPFPSEIPPTMNTATSHSL